MVVRQLVVFGSLGPLLALSRIVTKVLVDALEHLIVASACLDQLKHLGPVAKSHAKLEGQVLSLDVAEDLLSLIVLLEEASDFGLLLDFLLHL